MVSAIKLAGAIAAKQTASPAPAKPTGRKFSLNWKDGVMAAGVAIAIAGAVASFFMAMIAAGVAFVALGVLVGFSAYYVHNFNNGIALQETVDKLKKMNGELQAAQKKMQANVADLNKDAKEIKETNKKLNETIAGLNKVNKALEAANADLARNRKDFEKDLHGFQEENQGLKARVNQLAQSIPILKEQVSVFVDQNLQFGQHLNVLDGDIADLDAHNQAFAERVKGFDMTFDENVFNLSAQIQRAQSVSKLIFDALAFQKNDLHEQLGKLMGEVKKMQDLDVVLKERNQELTHLETEISKEREELNKLHQEMHETELSLQTTKSSLESEIKELHEVEALIAQDQFNLQEAQKELSKLPEKLALAEKTLEEKVASIKQLQKSSLRQVEEKIAGKIEEAKRLNEQIAGLQKQIEEKRRQLS